MKTTAIEQFSDLLGHTLASVHNDGDEVRFELEGGQIHRLYHEQVCCETVRVYDVAGDLDDLVGSPIVLADESSSSDHPEDIPRSEWSDSETWTFYRIGTIKCTVVIRWLGLSNGYYSERVSFR